MSNILDLANKIVNERAEEKHRQYGDFNESMDLTAKIFNAISGLDLTAEHMYKVIIAHKLAREKHAHKEDNLLDACAYIGALNNYIIDKANKNDKTKGEDVFDTLYGIDLSYTQVK